MVLPHVLSRIGLAYARLPGARAPAWSAPAVRALIFRKDTDRGFRHEQTDRVRETNLRYASRTKAPGTASVAFMASPDTHGNVRRRRAGRRSSALTCVKAAQISLDMLVR